MQYKAKRSEIPMNLKAIKTAEIAYEMEYDVFVPATQWPPGEPGKQTTQWPAGNEGFDTLYFQPSGDVRGRYWVEVDRTNFTAYGISDVDGDGVYATYVTTKSENPNSPITAPDVY